MMQVLRSLDKIATGYSVFEKDQVLTHEQLNSLASYLGDQNRLTRVTLVGVGLVCGLRVLLQANTVRVTKGVGVTTDGDLLRMADDAVFDRFKPYDEAAPRYEPFYSGQTRIAIYELVRAGVQDSRAALLSQFTTETQRALGEMVAVLLMESYLKDDDLCSGTDCDNLGKDAVHDMKLLLVDKASVSRLKEALSTPDAAARILSFVTADRPLIGPAGSLNQLAAVYRAACTSISKKLAPALGQVYSTCSGFIADLFPSDPTAGWLGRLSSIQASFAQSAVGIQYYYDFLKDVVETYNAFRDLLFGETTVCCPDVGAFPKHILLGNLVAATAMDRTGFYPSPATSCTTEQLRHARLLVRKLHTLIHMFDLPTGVRTLPVRITPSLCEDSSLEERAIPYYYDVNPKLPIHKSWSYALEKRGMEAYNYSYNADRYDAQGGAASPLTSQIGRFSFFRIEGHLGADVETVAALLESEIKSKNLPIAVQAVTLGTNRPRFPIRPRYTDLHRFHYLLRQDIVHQLDDVALFSGSFKQQVDQAVDAKIVTNTSEDTDGAPVKDIASQKNAAVQQKTALAKSKLTQKYSEYVKDPSWKSDVKDTVTAAGEFKYDLGKVVKTEFVTPFDSFIGTTHLPWLDWLDEIIKDKDEKEEAKLLFNNFLADHPGLEHFAGVVRGGTFVLVYDSTGTVVADFMLPYRCCDVNEEEAEEPVMPMPDVKPPWILQNGIKVLPSLDKFVADKLVIFKTEIEPEWKLPLDIQKEYFQVFKDSVTLMGEVYTPPEKTTLPLTEQIKVSDPYLGLLLGDTQIKTEKVDYLVNQIMDPSTDEDTRRTAETQLKTAEQELAKAIETTTQYVSSAKTDISAGSDGYKAMVSVSGSMTKLTDTTALNIAKTGLTAVNVADKPQLGNMIDTIMKRKGF